MDFDNYFGRNAWPGMYFPGYSKSAEDFKGPQHHRPQRSQNHQPNHHQKPNPQHANQGPRVRQVPVSDSDQPKNLKKEDHPPKTFEVPVASPKKPQPSKVNRYLHKPEDAALKIQSVLRGFLVRRAKPLEHLRIISNTKKKLVGFRAELGDPQRVCAIRESQKERVKLNEGVMRLLLDLDSVQGALPSIREDRKATVKEIVRFQEEIDRILNPAEAEDDQGREDQPDKMDEDEEDQEKGGDDDMGEAEQEKGGDDDMGEAEQEKGGEREEQEQEKGSELQEKGEWCHEDVKEDGVKEDDDMKIDDNWEMVDKQAAIDGVEEVTLIQNESRRILDSIVESAANFAEAQEAASCARAAAQEEQDKNKPEVSEGQSEQDQLVRRLIDENAQLRSLVTQCLKQSQMQNSLLCLLNDRVQKLEKKSKRLTRKK